MLVKICLLVALTAIVMAAPIEKIDESLSYEEQWTQFKSIHNRAYETPEEEARRFEIFKDNVNRIREHNKKYAAGETTFTMGINSFADLTAEEFSKTHLGFLPNKGQGLAGAH